MRLTKNKGIAAALILTVLVIAYLSSGQPRQQAIPTSTIALETSSPPIASPAVTEPDAERSPAPPSPDASLSSTETPAASPTVASPSASASAAASPSPPASTQAVEPPAPSGKDADGSQLELPKATEPSARSAMDIDPKTGKDHYLTEPVPEGKPLPIEPENAKTSDKQLTATLSVSCLTILNNMKLLDPEKAELVPKDGMIFKAQQVTFYEGESVFNVLQREMKKNKIHMEFVNTPIYNSAYIEGINNLYEFDCGELSGWMYKVNGWFPNYGASRYQLKQGDVIEWVYTCDLGRDVGDTYNSAGGGKKQ
ncbi:DUF4430 domain-containing protein [Paenibacillus oryzisoli]|uniref:Transcobalamin-like C-terminal domain-containing protein n=1 Tax=Paenibacillus oryzisoli TaxID=1850517 RepID=A0A198AG39_9BACL|nr:DUF4430 domain-containing protein [Paenibacillus oryzisoli]OAS19898.1 hypothetical protein A8708_09110 [Paenibacillus oryzisoli]